MRKQFEAAFERYLAHPSEQAFIVIEDAAGLFVQFGLEDGEIWFDLPTQALTPLQIVRAETFLVVEHGAIRAELEDEHFAYQIQFERDAEELADFSLDVFRRVFAASPELPLKIIVDE